MEYAKKRPHVVIVGCGFAGLSAARGLSKAPVTITILDRRNHHLFQPLLYQVATAGLSPSDVAQPIRSVLRHQSNVRVLLANVQTVDVKRQRVVCENEEFDFDYLVLATGATHSYFGHTDWIQFAPGIKTIEDAVEIRRRVLSAYETAERESEPGVRSEWLRFVVVGAGPTGVEMAGALAELSRHTLSKDFRKIDPASAEVYLVEAGARVLAAYPEALSAAAHVELERLGVRVRTHTPVTSIDRCGVILGQGEKILARTVIWAAGVSASPLGRTLEVPIDRAGRVIVEPSLCIPGHANIFVVGDLANVGEHHPVPGVAPAAMQMGRHVARNILRSVEGHLPRTFEYHDKGSLATIGRAAAVAHINGFCFSGFWAWLAWLMIHIFFLVGFRNRLLVFFEWAWAYFTLQRGARLITGKWECSPEVHTE